MPIRAENKSLYPKDWPAIADSIRLRANNRCEKCCAGNGEVISRGAGIHAGTYMTMDGYVFDDETGQRLGMARGSEYSFKTMVKIVLTVAHLDHTPENCDPENLRAWCQQCHNRYDAPMRIAGKVRRAREKLAVADMFDGVK